MTGSRGETPASLSNAKPKKLVIERQNALEGYSRLGLCSGVRGGENAGSIISFSEGL
jgi:hypothetical protein